MTPFHSASTQSFGISAADQGLLWGCPSGWFESRFTLLLTEEGSSSFLFFFSLTFLHLLVSILKSIFC